VAASLFSRVAELAHRRRLNTPPGSVKLTSRELEIVDAIADGLSNKEIAQRLRIETQTVKNHVHNILDKLHLHSRLEAVEYAHQSNLLNENKGKRDHRSAPPPEY
jgi:DNA-binding NarL/FixJ family response regulator